MIPVIREVLIAYGLDPDAIQIIPYGSGLINHTFKITGKSKSFILQMINSNVFNNPEDIAYNLKITDDYLKLTSPGYLFAAPLATTDGRTLLKAENNYYRLSSFIPNSHTVDFLTNSNQAFEAARQFGRFTNLLNNFEVNTLKYPLPNFHNLELRSQQFYDALKRANDQRLEQAKEEILLVKKFKEIGNVYKTIIQSGKMPLRVIHHDTKINNVLFDDNDRGLCVIDLDTVMPGYYISDVGDMMRTYLAEASEEEQNPDKIIIREEFFEAIYKGYMQEMADALTPYEKDLFIYSGKFMIYMQALRFLTDFLNGDVYYQTRYLGHNLNRAKNQLRLLEHYYKKEEIFSRIIRQVQPLEK